jgi:RNA polymerase sigma factor (sigma-70 family)
MVLTTEFFLATYPNVFKATVKKLKMRFNSNYHSCEDAVSEAALQIFTSLKLGTKNIISVDSYLYLIASRRLTDSIRKDKLCFPEVIPQYPLGINNDFQVENVTDVFETLVSAITHLSPMEQLTIIEQYDALPIVCNSEESRLLLVSFKNREPKKAKQLAKEFGTTATNIRQIRHRGMTYLKARCQNQWTYV